MIKTSYQTPELRDANDNVVQEGAFGKNAALTNSTNDGWIDYVMNDLEALHDTIGDSAPTLDGNGHVVEPANLAIGDEDGVRLKTGYLKTSGGTVSGTLNIAQNLKMQDNQENVFGGLYVPASSATSQFLQVYGGEQPNGAGNARLTLYRNGIGQFNLTSYSVDGSTQYQLVGGSDGTLKWRGNTLAPLASPAFTGNPTAPTQALNNDSTRVANTAYVINELKANAVLTSNALATQIQSGDDLDNYKTAGTYYSSGASVSASLQNCPWTTSGFKMVVMITHGGFVLQTLYTYGNEIFMRGYNASNGRWFNWTQLARAENVLSLTGGTLTGPIQVASTLPQYVSKFTNVVSGENPTSTKQNYVFKIFDENDAVLGGIYKYFGSNGTNDIRIYHAWGNKTTYFGMRIYGESWWFIPGDDNTTNLGSSNARWKQLYAGTTTISTSDERLKDNIVPIPDEVLDAWGEVGWYQYQFKDSIAEKGETKARIHTGAIAQRIESVFDAHGLDANKYGLLCYDEWKAEPAERDEDGNVIQESRPAGNRYSLRYEEALCMEAAYQRRRAEKLEQRLEAIEQRLSALETL